MTGLVARTARPVHAGPQLHLELPAPLSPAPDGQAKRITRIVLRVIPEGSIPTRSTADIPGILAPAVEPGVGRVERLPVLTDWEAHVVDKVMDVALFLVLAGWLLVWALREAGHVGVRRGRGPRRAAGSEWPVSRPTDADHQPGSGASSIEVPPRRLPRGRR